MGLTINEQRLLADLEALRSITDTPGRGVTRLSYSEADRAARAYLAAAAAAFGAVTTANAVGNLIIRLPNQEKFGSAESSTGSRTKPGPGHGNAPIVCVGSHIDTVRNGGWLDGIYGVVGGLEVLRTLAESNPDKARRLEVVVFAEEEGTNFGSTMTGSKFAVGTYDEAALDRLRDDGGRTLRDHLMACGFPPFRPDDVLWDFSQIRAMLELHIEQGPVLDRSGELVGVVDAIFGMTTIEVTLAGVGNHAGASPMEGRRDALAAAAICISEVEAIGRRDPDSALVATVGKIQVDPNCSNVIPERVVFTIEARDRDQHRIDRAIEEARLVIQQIAAVRGVEVSIRSRAASAPGRMDPILVQILDRLATEAGLPHRIMDSGAVHDTCLFAPLVPSGMIFVPSIGGRSHVPEENTATEHLVAGASLLLAAVRELLQE